MEKDQELLLSRLENYELATIDDIYTNVNGAYNLKPRLVYCQYCKLKIITDLPGVQCKKCNSDLITYVGSMLNELA